MFPVRLAPAITQSILLKTNPAKTNSKLPTWMNWHQKTLKPQTTSPSIQKNGNVTFMGLVIRLKRPFIKTMSLSK